MKSRYAVVACLHPNDIRDRKKAAKLMSTPFSHAKSSPPSSSSPGPHSTGVHGKKLRVRGRSAARYGQALLVSRKKKVLMRSEQYRRPPSDDGDTSVLSSPIYFLLMHIFIQVQEFTDVFLNPDIHGH